MISLNPLSSPDYLRYKHYFENQRYELCAYSLSSAICWRNEEYHPLGAEYDESFIVAAEFKNVKKNRHLILPVSPTREIPPDELALIAERTGYSTYWFVPEAYINHFGTDTVERYFDIQPHGAYDDYVYLVEDLAELKGNRYSKKRNLINQFKRDYANRDRVTIERIAPENTEACLIFLEEWCRERDCDADDQVDLACEKQAAINTLINFEAFDLNGILLRIDGTVNAFGISAPLTPDMATLQYEKAFGSIKGLYQYFDNACANMLFNGYTYLNKESDMGIPGLAKAKKSYLPHKMIRSFKLMLKA
jgi:uncharacterized protein